MHKLNFPDKIMIGRAVSNKKQATPKHVQRFLMWYGFGCLLDNGSSFTRRTTHEECSVNRSDIGIMAYSLYALLGPNENSRFTFFEHVRIRELRHVCFYTEVSMLLSVGNTWIFSIIARQNHSVKCNHLVDTIQKYFM